LQPAFGEAWIAGFVNGRRRSGLARENDLAELPDAQPAAAIRGMDKIAERRFVSA
jgi:hypothetical protein